MNAATEPPHRPTRAPERPLHAPNFERSLVAILGLPFDALTIDEVVEGIRSAAFAGRRCFVSTPNLNFAIAARRDAAFRLSVLRSDLSLADGMPLVWVARLLGVQLPERVSGADLFDALQAHRGAPLSVYLFGGPEGAAAAASERINARDGGLRCVGFDGGGFGPVESLSGADRIERINRSGAHFVVVALGAVKGQAWIEHNATRLAAPVLSHLGAVVNFAAGTLARAPRWMQTSGLEWLWRIKEEPALWRRYGGDALAASRLIARCVLPERLATFRRRLGRALPPRLEATLEAGTTTIALHGAWRDDGAGDLRLALAEAVGRGARAIIDVHGASELGAAVIGPLLVAEGWFRERAGFGVVGATPALARSIRRQLAKELL